MSSTGVYEASGLATSVTERDELWKRRENSVALAEKLTQLSSSISAGEESTMPGTLTTENLPPAELAVAIPMIEAELRKAAEIGDQIVQCESEIKGIHSKSNLLLVVIILVAVVAIVVVVSAFTRAF